MQPPIKSLRQLVGQVIRRTKNSEGYLSRPYYYYLASFPKSGNTWVRVLVSAYLSQDPEHFVLKELGHYVPDLHHEVDRGLLADPSTRFHSLPVQFVKTHNTYKRTYRNSIYIVRDGRDALTSFYHWVNRRRAQPLTLREIIDGQSFAGSWSAHVMGWLGGRGRRLLVKYEDLLRDTPGQLAEILSFVGMKPDLGLVERAVAAGSFDRMRALERSDREERGETVRSETMFVRKGGSGDWRNLFSAEDEKLFWAHHERAMRTLGYGQ